jgi:peptidoglycan/xylan/chitin deacetylase (PgdA/CDA1 family)
VTQRADARIPILMYHEVAERAEMDALARKTQRGYILAREDFEQQMDLLSRSGFHPISLAALRSWSHSQAPLPPKPVVITFDDGFAGNFKYAFPALSKHNFTATFFVVTNKIGDSSMLTWTELEEMNRHGMSIQSHTANHPLLSTLTEARTRMELMDSKQVIEDKIGAPVNFLSLPNGDSNPFYVGVAQACGYVGGCCSRFGFNDRNTDPFFWRRIAVKNGIQLKDFSDIVFQNSSALAILRTTAAAKTAASRLLGKKNYDRLYNLVFGVEDQDKSMRP